ncbi:MAG: Fe-S protein assembly chaperone HscA [Alphaproteobacteria bacterium]|nr:Fe-S protein assembly chaperone HscA [Alphaproteobacteria bacterium]
MTLLQIHEPGKTPLPHAKRALAVGIDLGTTNSLVAVSENAKPLVLRDAQGHCLVPSAVLYTAGTIQVGELARAAIKDHPERVVVSIKRLMGRGAEDIMRVADTLPYELDTSTTGMVRVKVGGRTLTPVEVSAHILEELRARAERTTGREVRQAVITVPAHFDDAARNATKDAAKLAGLQVLRLVNEPTAAALAYGLDKGAQGTYAIYDLGGGTFDVSVLRLEMGVFQVLSSGGDVMLGGDDFDRVVAERFLEERARMIGAERLATADVKRALAVARTAREHLTQQETGSWPLDLTGRLTWHSLDQATLNQLIAPKVEETLQIARGVLDDAKLEPGQLDGVVLVGGATRTPLVRKRVGEFFGRPPLTDINPDEVVALGAALQAEALTRGSDALLLDVTPLSLGLETMGGLVEKIVPRNTTIPVAIAQEFTTYQDGQTAMAIHVVQGERELVSENRSLARFDLTGIPPMTAGAARIRVMFAVDADGLLTVSAEEVMTGTRQEIAVKPSYGLSETELTAMLRASIDHARGDMEERVLREARVDGERLLLAIESALRADADLLDVTERRDIDDGRDRLRTAIEGTDRTTILDAVDALNTATEAFAARRMDRGIRSALRGVAVNTLAERLEAPETQQSGGRGR